ncbi:MAG: hypothetical protein CBB92_03190 [Flammeovirgaceae bacterium TMED32]|nr:MAG: hypothetical protein CBB92_03190 [Flammeovirgaceae bacterium TMED32]
MIITESEPECYEAGIHIYFFWSADKFLTSWIKSPISCELYFIDTGIMGNLIKELGIKLKNLFI